jgi:hypothetical protein
LSGRNSYYSHAGRGGPTKLTLTLMEPTLLPLPLAMCLSHIQSTVSPIYYFPPLANIFLIPAYAKNCHHLEGYYLGRPLAVLARSSSEVLFVIVNYGLLCTEFCRASAGLAPILSFPQYLLHTSARY